MAEATAHEAVVGQTTAEDILAAFAGCFQPPRLLAAGLGLGVTVVLAGGAGIVAASHLLRNALMSATLLGFLGAGFLYAGVLVTYGALARMSAAEQAGCAVHPGEAFAFALRRVHILVGLPFVALTVAGGIGALGVALGSVVSGLPSAGSALAPLALVILFVLNLVLAVGLLLAHCLTAPCVACVDVSFAATAGRLTEIAQGRLGAFLTYQAAAFVAALPLIVFTAGLFLAAFQPAFLTTLGGSTALEPGVEEQAAPMSLPLAGSDDWADSLTAAVAWGSRVGAPLASTAVVLQLLLAIVPLVYWASVQCAVYRGLTGDSVALAESDQAGPPPADLPLLALRRHQPDRGRPVRQVQCGAGRVPLLLCDQRPRTGVLRQLREATG